MILWSMITLLNKLLTGPCLRPTAFLGTNINWFGEFQIKNTYHPPSKYVGIAKHNPSKNQLLAALQVTDTA